MIRRFFNALQRGLAEQVPPHPLRPNELSLEVARAERLRRETRRAGAARQPAPPAPQEQPRRERQSLPSALEVRPTPLGASLKSRSELRRALLLKEILGPPAALRWPHDGDPGV